MARIPKIKYSGLYIQEQIRELDAKIHHCYQLMHPVRSMAETVICFSLFLIYGGTSFVFSFLLILLGVLNIEVVNGVRAYFGQLAGSKGILTVTLSELRGLNC